MPFQKLEKTGVVVIIEFQQLWMFHLGSMPLLIVVPGVMNVALYGN